MAFVDPVNQWLYENVREALELFESQPKEFGDYSYVQHYTQEILILVFTRIGRENAYFMVSIYGNPEDYPAEEKDYFQELLTTHDVSPFQQLSYHAIVGEKGEGESYADHASEIVETIFIRDERSENEAESENERSDPGEDERSENEAESENESSEEGEGA